MSFMETLVADLARLRPQDSGDDSEQIPNVKVFSALLNPRSWPVVMLRIACALYTNQFTKPVAMIFTWLSTFLFGFECTPRCKIGKGLLIPHSHGTVIGAAEIGEHVTIFQGVTLGAKFADLSYQTSSRPKVGNNVIIGAGAKILGGITIGDGAVVAANSLVLENVPDNARVMGVPARMHDAQ